MNPNRYDVLFENYLTNITLTRDQADKIDHKIEETLSLFLREYKGDVDIYSQGSYAMGTTVRPLTVSQSPSGRAGEYDVDMVLERSTWQGARESLTSVRNVLSEEYADKLDTKLHQSCERVLHDTNNATEVSFHVDYVPIKTFINNRCAARRDQDEWFGSDTKQLVEWFADYSETYTYLPSIILVVKRMRDNADLADVLSSICITALVCDLYEETTSYIEDLISVIDGVIERFNVPHERLSITVEPLEDDLADRISSMDQQKILSFFNDCKNKLENGIANNDLDMLRLVLSTSFPSDWGEFPESLQALRSRGWGVETDGSLQQVNISESGTEGSFISKIRKRFNVTGESLVFHANQYDTHQYGIRWQVLNAQGSPKRRGNLFEAKGPSGNEGSSSNKFVNHETESYTGEHWIKYYIYNKSSKRVVEIGKKFFVEVSAS